MPPPFSKDDVVKIGTTIKILFYGDDPLTNWSVVPQPAPGSQLRHEPTEFGLRILKDTLEGSSTWLMRLSVDVLLRHHTSNTDGSVRPGPTPGLNKLTPELLKKYDQVWFFGQLYANYSTWIDGYGGPEAELTNAEVTALRKWMDAGGGVLITGDHSNDASFGESALLDPALKGKTLNLGRALGWRVPRAGEMRVWVGAPDSGPPDYYVDTAGDPDMGMMPKQEDAIPQTIRVGKVWRKVSLPTPGPLGGASFWWPEDHPLFVGRPNADFPSSRIDILPDHVHEGAVHIPRSFDPSVWPRRGNFQPTPEIVAWGTNKAPRRWFAGLGPGDRISLNPEVGEVAAYDGDIAGVGRIVAHSTWHHFVNVNLVGFRKPDGTPGKVLLRLGEYFRNLAVWLSPSSQRWKHLTALVAWVARHPFMREVHGAAVPVVGQTAVGLLGDAVGHGVLGDLLNLPLASQQPAGDAAPVQAALPANLLLGRCILDEQKRLLRDAGIRRVPAEHLLASADAAIDNHAATLQQAAAALREWKACGVQEGSSQGKQRKAVEDKASSRKKMKRAKGSKTAA